MCRTAYRFPVLIVLGLFAARAVGSDPPLKPEPPKADRAGAVGDYLKDGQLTDGNRRAILDHPRHRILDHRSTASAFGTNAGRRGERCVRWTTSPRSDDCIATS